MAEYVALPEPKTVESQVYAVSTDNKYLGYQFDDYQRQWLGEWTVERIRCHRDGHQNGRIFMGKRLARFFKRDSNVVGALGQRVAPWLGCPHELKGGSEAARAELTPMLAEGGTVLTAATRRDAAEDLALCGMAVQQTTWVPRVGGTRWDPIVSIWDLEATDTVCGQLVAITRDGRVPINHGDGKWTVIRTNELHTWESGGVVSLALHVASRSRNIIDRTAAGQAVGHPKLHGELPEKVAVNSPEGLGFEAALAKLWGGVKHIVAPNGAKVNKLEFSGTGWQIFRDGPKMDKSDIFLALTGQDGSAANEGGSYTKALILEGVLFAWVEADTIAGSYGYTQGLLRPWAVINRGDASEAPAIRWPLPDLKQQAILDALVKRHTDFASIVQAYKAAGATITPVWIKKTSAALGIEVPEWQMTLDV